MAKGKLKIETGKDNPILRTKSLELRDLKAKTPKLGLPLADFLNGMLGALKDEKGLGIAAPQVGENLRISLTRIDADKNNEILFVMINPRITWRSDERGEEDAAVFVEGDERVNVAEEGCLSLPKYWVNVARASEVSVEFFDGREILKKGRGFKGALSDLPKMVLKLKGINARLAQHELDHLNAILICDKG